MAKWKIFDTLLDVGPEVFRAGWKIGDALYDLTHPKPDWGATPSDGSGSEKQEVETPGGVDEDGDFYPAD